MHCDLSLTWISILIEEALSRMFVDAFTRSILYERVDSIDMYEIDYEKSLMSNIWCCVRNTFACIVT